MKKLRMIITSVIVLALAGSAFAFKVKRGSFCISTDANNSCDLVVQNVRRVIGTPNQRYYPGWSGDLAECTGPDSCKTQVRFDFN
jgi:hypothetical protein